MKSKYQEITGPKVSADPSLEGAPSEKNIQKEVSEKLVDSVKKVFVKKQEETAPQEQKKQLNTPAYEGQQTETLFDPKDIFKNMTPQKTLKLVAGVFLIFIIIAAVYVRFIRKEPVGGENVVITPPTPTYAPYERFIPSIYTKDPNFISIQEGMSVLTQESTTTPIKETTLQPPSLDYEIGFLGVDVDE